MDGLRLNLPKIKIPARSALQFEIPGDDPQNPNYARTLEGVILFNHAANAYWPDGSDDDENAMPLCASQAAPEQNSPLPANLPDAAPEQPTGSDASAYVAEINGDLEKLPA
jgi:hypothetical protein